MTDEIRLIVESIQNCTSHIKKCEAELAFWKNQKKEYFQLVKRTIQQ